MERPEGFEAGDQQLPEPPVAISDETRDRMALTLMAMVEGAGSTPEEIAGFLEHGFPASVHEALERPGEYDEIRAHLNLLLYVQQTPAPAAV